MHNHYEAETAQETLDYIERCIKKAIATLEVDLGPIVPAKCFTKDMAIVREAIDELVFEPVRDAKKVISDYSRIEQRAHERSELIGMRA